MAKAKDHKIAMYSAESTHMYTTTKSREFAKKSEKLVLMKYDPIVRKHAKYTEGKIKK